MAGLTLFLRKDTQLLLSQVLLNIVLPHKNIRCTGTNGCLRCPRTTAQTHTRRIPSILKDIWIQVFWFCLCSTKRKMKEIGKGKEAQYKLFGFNIEGDREIPTPRTCFMGNQSSFTRPRRLKGRACWQPEKLKHCKSQRPDAIFIRTPK